MDKFSEELQKIGKDLLRYSDILSVDEYKDGNNFVTTRLCKYHQEGQVYYYYVTMENGVVVAVGE